MAHKLLLADDSVTIQRVIELTFADEDVEVTTVGDGQLAIDRLDNDPPDIVLADVDMPKRDGYEVAAYVKSRPKLAHIPVVLLTGAFEPIDQARAAASGSNDVLAKPFEPQMVINRVKELLSRKSNDTEPLDTAWSPPPRPSMPQPPRSTDPLLSSRGLEEEPGPVVSLDDYFDQLDAAFSNLHAEAPASDHAPLQLEWGHHAPPPTMAPVDAGPSPALSSPLPGAPEAPATRATDAEGGTAAAEQPHPVAVFTTETPTTWSPSPVARDTAVFAQEPAVVTATERVEHVAIAGVASVAPVAPVVPSAPVVLDAPGLPIAVVAPIAPVTPVAVAPPGAPVAPVAPSAPATPAAPRTTTNPFATLSAAKAEAAAARPTVPVISEEVIEEVVSRVLRRLTDQVVRETVTDIVSQTAERLVQEEIERIKNGQ